MPNICSATELLKSQKILFMTVLMGFIFSSGSIAAELTGSSQKKSPEKPKVISPEQAQMMKFQEDMINQSQQMLEMMQKNPAFNPASGKPAMPQLSPELAAFAAASGGLPKRDEAGITWAKNRVVTAATTQSYLQSVTANAEKALPQDAVKRAEVMLAAQQKIDGGPQAIARLAIGGVLAKRYAEGLYLMGRAALADPAHPDHINNYAAMLNITGGGQAAVPILNHLNSTYPRHSTVLNNLGQAWLSIGDLEEAEKKLKESISFAGHHSQANHSLSYIQEAKGDRQAALQSIKNSIKKAFGNDKMNRIRKLGGKITNKDLDWTLPMPEDALGLSQFTYPEYISNSASQPELGPQWKTHEEQLVKAAEVFGKQAGPLQQQSIQETYADVEYARQFHKERTTLWLKQKADLKLRLMQEDRSDYEKNQKKHLDARLLQVINEQKRLEKIYTSAVDKMLRAADKVPVEGGGDVDCGQIIKLADTYLDASKELIGNYNNEWLAWLRRTTNEEAYFAKFTKSATDFELTKVLLKFRYLFAVGQMPHPYDTNNAYQCVAPNYNKSPYGKLADFYDLHCDHIVQLKTGWGELEVRCNKMNAKFKFDMFGIGIEGTRSDNLDTETMNNATLEFGYSAGKSVSDGPFSLGAKGELGGFIELDKTGITDIGIKASASVDIKATKDNKPEIVKDFEKEAGEFFDGTVAKVPELVKNEEASIAMGANVRIGLNSGATAKGTGLLRGMEYKF